MCDPPNFITFHILYVRYSRGNFRVADRSLDRATLLIKFNIICARPVYIYVQTSLNNLQNKLFVVNKTDCLYLLQQSCAIQSTYVLVSRTLFFFGPLTLRGA